ncbi:hypothetical protein MJ904_11455 [Massilia sp. MB5]|uniref:hypothetical protein n=1 Tax=unclassified Massilia TaxID=2609279 RepID=UPI00067CD0C7|nr:MULTISPECIES: hypothetical protein [unclassified Massilia]AKU22496.1 hypothetical protein ACZ75_14470 [Massilia sp. NR 4-1]UMR32719.1 hypothetical protein MJ904_11455 [Massilia sp. MB5]
MIKKVLFVFALAMGSSYAMAEPDCRETCQGEVNVCYATHPLSPYLVKYCTRVYESCMEACQGSY